MSAWFAPLTQAVLRELLLPRQWKPSEDRSFFLDAEQVNSLCDQAERIFMEEPTVLRLRGECCLTMSPRLLQIHCIAFPAMARVSSLSGLSVCFEMEGAPCCVCMVSAEQT